MTSCNFVGLRSPIMLASNGDREERSWIGWRLCCPSSSNLLHKIIQVLILWNLSVLFFYFLFFWYFASILHCSSYLTDEYPTMEIDSCSSSCMCLFEFHGLQRFGDVPSPGLNTRTRGTLVSWCTSAPGFCNLPFFLFPGKRDCDPIKNCFPCVLWKICLSAEKVEAHLLSVWSFWKM